MFNVNCRELPPSAYGARTRRLRISQIKSDHGKPGRDFRSERSRSSFILKPFTYLFAEMLQNVSTAGCKDVRVEYVKHKRTGRKRLMKMQYIGFRAVVFRYGHLCTRFVCCAPCLCTGLSDVVNLVFLFQVEADLSSRIERSLRGCLNFCRNRLKTTPRSSYLLKL